MGYSVALLQSVRHLSREALKASQSWLRFLFVLQCQLQILIHILQWWMRMETSELQIHIVRHGFRRRSRAYRSDITVTWNNTCHKQCVANTSSIFYAAC